MVAYIPALLALALNLDGVHIFKEMRAINNGPHVSCFVFMVASFIFITHLDLYPLNFRKLWWCGDMVYQFLCAQLMFEYLIADFWFPLEESFFYFIHHMVEILDEWDQMGSMKGIMDYLKSETTGIVGSYMLSCFFLVAALHGTKVVNFSILDCGLGAFMHHIYKSTEEFLVASMTNFSSNKSPSKTKKCKIGGNGNKKKDFDETDEDDEEEWQPPKKSSRRRH